MPRPRKSSIKQSDVFGTIADQLREQARQPNIYGYKPHEKQIQFHSSSAKIRLFIGGNRSGKTVSGATESIYYALGNHPYKRTPPPPTRGRAIAVDFIQGVAKIMLPEIAKWVPKGALRGGSWTDAYDKQLRTLNFENGSFIEFLSYDQDLDKFAGTSRHHIWFDEEPPQTIWSENRMRLLDTNGDAWVSMTPVEGMTWVYDEIYEPAADNPYIEVVEVHQAENPYLPLEEREAFLSGLSADERQAREEGKFVAMGGLIYKNFKTERNVIEPFEVPKDWMWVCSLDHGFNNQTAWLWCAVDPDGNYFVFDEHYVSGKVVSWHAKEVLKKCEEYGRPPDYYVGDPSIRNTDPITGSSILIEYVENGVPIVLGNNDVRAGINKVARLFEGPNFGEEGNRPQLFITKNCENLLKELRKYRWAKWATKKMAADRNNKEEPNKKDDHACDALRYFVMSRPEVEDHTKPSHTAYEHLKGYSSVSPTAPRIDESLVRPKQTKYKHVDAHLGGEW